jgi:hypothetical protein
MPAPEWTKIKFAPGIFPDETPGEAEAFWRDGSWVRFVLTAGGKIAALQVMGGWERASGDTVAGKVRKILQHAMNLGYAYAAIGSHTSTWALFDGQTYFTTPIVSYGVLSNPFTVSNGSATVTVAHTSHGRATGDYVNFPGQPSFNGITLDDGYYAVTVVNANSYTITASEPATSGGAGVGGTVDYEYFLAAGLEYSIGGAGYGTGPYGSGVYGIGSAATFAARTWTFAPFGQNVIGAPRGGGVYELAPYFSSTDLAELVTNGSFTGSSTGWTEGAGWAYSANAEAATLADGNLEQSISIKAGAWHLIKFNATRSAGSVQVRLNGTAVGSAVTATGRYFLRVWGGAGGAQTLAFDGTGFTGTIDNVSVRTLGTFAPLANAPTQVTGVLVTPKGHVEVWGCVPSGETEFDPMCIKGSDADDPQDWTIAIGSEALEEFASGGSRIVTGVVGGDRVYYLTDTLLLERTYRGLPGLTWSTVEKGEDCGCIGINAACYAAGRLWWMGNNKTFWVYDGTQPQPLLCPGNKWVFDNIQFTQEDLIQCWHNAQFKEIWWEWADRRDGTNELSRYAAYNYETGVWVFGTRVGNVRTATGAPRKAGFPISAGADGYLYFHEKGDNANGAPLTGRVRSGAFDIGDGNTLAEISGYIPDTQDQAGSYTIRFYGYEFNDKSTPEDSGALVVTPNTQNLMNFFVQGRQIEWELEFNDAPMRLRLGNPRFLIQDTGNQF